MNLRNSLSILQFQRTVLLITFVAVASPALHAEACHDNPFQEAKLIKGPEGIRAEVLLLDPISQEYGSFLPQDRVKVTTKGGKKSDATSLTIIAAEITQGFGRKFLRISVTGNVAEDQTEVQVTLTNTKFACPDAAAPTLVSSAAGTGKIYNLDQILEEDKKALADAVAHAKTSDEKLFSGGFSASKGDGQKTEGDADVSANYEIKRDQTVYGGALGGGLPFDKAIISLHVKKATAEKADPRYLTLGVTLRKAVLLGGRKEYFEELGKLGNRTLSEDDLVKHKDNRDKGNPNQYKDIKDKGFFRALLIDESLNLENESFQFRSTNFVSDTKLQFASIAKALGGTNGFFNMRIVVGPELGRSLEKPQPTTDTTMMDSTTAAQLEKVNWIARFKAGAQFSLRYMPNDDLGGSWGMALDLGFVNRHLFRDEATIEEKTENGMTTMKQITVGKGDKTWRQADLKMFLFGGPKARYGFKLGYNYGRLPPVFSFTKALTFGIVIETKDDKASGGSAKQ